MLASSVRPRHGRTLTPRGGKTQWQVIGNPHEFTIRELADLVINLTGSKSKIITTRLPSDDPKQRQPDISLAKKILDWEPKVELLEGLNKTIFYFKELLSEGDIYAPHREILM